MEKQVIFRGQSEQGVFCRPLFSSMSKTASLDSGWDMGDEIRKVISGISAQQRKENAYVLVNALGAGEFFGSNINSDFFEWNMLAHEGDDYGYKTFLKAHCYTHHQNRDPTKAIGKPIASMLNSRMKRVELIIEINREKARLEGADGIITRIDNGEFPDVSMGCLPSGGRILLPSGLTKPIEQIAVGDIVVSHKGISQEVTSVMKRAHTGDLYSIKSYGNIRKLRLTGEHPLWLVRKDQLKCRPKGPALGKRPRGYQKHCTPLVKTKSKGCFGCVVEPKYKFDWVRADAAKKGDYLAIPLLGQSSSDITSVDLARFLGFYLAEGHVGNYNDRVNGRITFSLNFTEKDLALEIEEIARRLGSTVCWHEDKEHVGGRNVVVVSSKLASLCLEHCGKYAKEKRLSNSILYMAPELQLHFIGAYLDGDGGTYKGSAYLSTSSEKLAGQLPLLLARCGIISSVNTLQHTPSEKSVVRTNTVEFQVWIGTDFSYLLSGYTRKPVHRSKKLRGSRFFYTHDGTTYILTPISSITKEGFSGDVFNFSVGVDESYVAEGTAVHNCRVPYDVCSLCNNHSKTRNDYCFVPGTKITMADGSRKAIEDIAVGDLVLDKDGLQTKVIRLMKRDVNECIMHIKTSLNGNTLRTTKNHPILSSFREEFSCYHRTTQPNTRSCFPGALHHCLSCKKSFVTPKFISAGDIRKDDSVYSPSLLTTKPTELSSEDAYIIGLFMAEGCYSKQGGHRSGVEFSLHEKETDLVSCVNEFASKFGREAKVYKSSGKGIRVRIHSREAAEFFYRYCGEYAHNKKASKEIVELPDPLLRLYLQGLWDGDGHISKIKNNYSRLNSASENLIWQTSCLLRRLGFTSYVGVALVPGGPSNRSNKHTQWYLVTDYGCSGKRSESSIQNTTQMGQVVRIEEQHYVGPVFNFETESHTYVAEGVAVHNCEHMRPPTELVGVYGPNKILPDGRRVFVYNPYPRFFDISFVFIGADKTAKVMTKLAQKGNQVCLGPICTLEKTASVVTPTKEQSNSPSIEKTACMHFEEDGLHGPCGGHCASCVKQSSCHMDKIASAFTVKTSAHKKLSEIIKEIPTGTFAMKKLPALESSEPSIPRDTLNALADKPLEQVLSGTTGMGMVLKPAEFQRIVLMRMGEEDLADELDGHGGVFRSGLSPSFAPMGGDMGSNAHSILPLLRGILGQRTAFGQPLKIRIMIVKNHNPIPTPKEIEHPLLDKIGSAYSAYRRSSLEKVSQAARVVESDCLLREAVLGENLVSMFKTATDARIVDLDSVTYLMGAYLKDRGLNNAAVLSEKIAATNPGLLSEPMAKGTDSPNNGP